MVSYFEIIFLYIKLRIKIILSSEYGQSCSSVVSKTILIILLWNVESKILIAETKTMVDVLCFCKIVQLVMRKYNTEIREQQTYSTQHIINNRFILTSR